MVISLLHATRKRPQQARSARALWLQQAKHPEQVEYFFAFDVDDADSRNALEGWPHVTVSPGGSCVAAWNAAAEASSGQVLVQLSDDWHPPRGWDQSILDRLGVLCEPKVLAVSDGHRRDDLLCMAILTRKRYEDQGWLFYPGYSGVWSDREFTHRAYADGVVLEARDLCFEHRHPLFDPSVPMDATYRHQNREEAYARGKALFLQRNPGAAEKTIQTTASNHDPRLALLKARIHAHGRKKASRDQTRE